jgi:cohesin loading factor subunit SCC2
VHRALAVMGALCRNHAVKEAETDSWMEELKDDMAVEAIPDEVTPVQLIESCYRVFSAYLAKVDVETKCSALRALGGIFVSRPRVLLAMEQSGAIAELMSDNSMPEIQLQALRSWREILLAEEDRVASGEAKAKMEANANVTLSKKIQGDQDSDATLVGGVLSQHANRLFQLTACRNPLIRFAAVELLGHLLRQGLINPMQAVPFLFGLQGDVESPNIRSFALKLLTIESEKRPEMIRQRVNAGIKQAYRFQRHVYPNQEVTAVIQTQNGDKLVIDSMFSSVFKDCIRSSTKNKTGLFRNLLSLFEIDESNDAKKKEKGTTAVEMIPLLSFVSQVLAHLPYNSVNDPLFLIYHMQGQVALQGQQLVDKLTAFLQSQGVPSVTVHDELNTQEDALEIAATKKHPSRSKEASAVSKADFELGQFVDMCAQASAFVLLLRLKSFLRTAYNISEARCLEYSPDAKERNWDKISSSPNFPSVFDARIKSFFRSEPQSKKASVKHMSSREISRDALIKQYAEFRALMRVEQAADIKLDSDDEDDSKKRKLKHVMEDQGDAMEG